MSVDKITVTLESFCDLWLKSWSSGSAQELIEFYHPNVTYQDPAKPNGIHGRDHLLIYLKKLLAKYPSWQWRRLKLYPIETGFFLKWEAQLKNGRPFYGLDLVELKENKIIRNEVYFDPSVLLN